LTKSKLFSAHRTAVICPWSGTGLAEGETGQAEPDWPASAGWLWRSSPQNWPCTRERASPFGRTAVRPYKRNMILNGITDQEDWLPALPHLPGAEAPASLLVLIFPTPYPVPATTFYQPHFCYWSRRTGKRQRSTFAISPAVCYVTI